MNHTVHESCAVDFATACGTTTIVMNSLVDSFILHDSTSTHSLIMLMLRFCILKSTIIHPPHYSCTKMRCETRDRNAKASGIDPDNKITVARDTIRQLPHKYFWRRC